MRCARVRGLFGAYWDDEITQAEREWIEAHFASCPACREEYESYSRALELVAALPREEVASDLVERVMARTRRSSPAADQLPAPRVAWIPVTAAAALAILTFATLSPWLRVTRETHPSPPPAAPAVAARAPVRIGASPAPRRAAAAAPASGAAVATLADSLFDHSEDVEFILDPGTVRRGHVRPLSPRASSVQGERAVISF